MQITVSEKPVSWLERTAFGLLLVTPE
jgi:hypothetical protein